MSKIVVLGDAHVRNRTWPRLELYGDSFVAMREVVDAARAEGATLVASGDLFDSGLGHDAPRCVEAILDATKGIGDVVYAVGNHDRTGAAGGARNPEWVAAVLARKYPWRDVVGDTDVGDNWWYEEGRVHEVNGLRYAVIHHQTDGDAFNVKLAGLEDAKARFDVLVCHQGVDELLGYKGAYEVVVADLAPRLAARGCRLCICGHVHVVRDWERDGVTFVSPGTIYAETIADDQAKMFPVITVDDDVTVEWRQLRNQRRIRRLTAAGSDDDYDCALAGVESLRAEAEALDLPRAIATPVLAVTYVARPGFRRMLEEAAAGSVVLDLMAVRDEECLDARPPAAEVEPERLGEIAADIERITALHTLEGPVRTALVAIQNGADPTTVIEEHIAKLVEA